MAVIGGLTQVIEFSAEGDARTGKLFVMGLRWAGITNATHSIIVTDTANNEIWHSHGVPGLDQTETMFPSCLPVDGIKVPTMGSGELYVYIE